MGFSTEMWRNRAACKGVDGFERPAVGEWDTEEPRLLCAICPVKRECATAALTSGSTLDAIAATPADDVIAAGVICEGDDRTARALQAVIKSREYKPRQPIPEHCKTCGWKLCSEKVALVVGTIPHHSNGTCTLCYQKARYRQTRTANMPALF